MTSFGVVIWLVYQKCEGSAISWTSPRTWVANVTAITALALNTDLRDNLNYLKGLLDGSGSDNVFFPRGAIAEEGGEYGLGVGARLRLFHAVSNAAYIANNIYRNAAETQWLLNNTGLVGWMMSLGVNDGGFGDDLSIYRTPAGAGARTLTTILSLASDGKLTGAGFYASGAASLANATTASLSHGLGARPRFVWGWFSTTSLAEAADSSTAAIFPIRDDQTLGTSVGLSDCSSTTLRIYNNTGGTAYYTVCAML